MSHHRPRPYSYAPAGNLMTTREVAGMLAISAQTVRRLVRAGELRAVRVGGSVRFRIDDVAELVRRGLLDGEGADRKPAAAR